MATYRQRIIALYQGRVISKSKYDELIARERRIRGGLELVRTKIDENFDDFRARSYATAKCRGKLHKWEDFEGFDLGYRPMGGVFTETERCERCGKIKVTVINGIGQKDRSIYIDPPGFKLSGAQPSKDDWKQLARYIELGYELDSLEEGESPSEDAEIVHLHRTG